KSFWTTVKNKAKRSQFEGTGNLVTRITEACSPVPPTYLQAIVQHSVDIFKRCLNGEPIQQSI
ncbi:hypothetical protein BCV72DRAFT_206316, partial [Rhizopus microsporus var. microsporus]